LRFEVAWLSWVIPKNLKHFHGLLYFQFKSLADQRSQAPVGTPSMYLFEQRMLPSSTVFFVRQSAVEAIPPSVLSQTFESCIDEHKSPAVQRWLKRHPRFKLHFTPTSSSWLNLVERPVRRDHFASEYAEASSAAFPNSRAPSSNGSIIETRTQNPSFGPRQPSLSFSNATAQKRLSPISPSDANE
jgi:hypothetical protein